MVQMTTFQHWFIMAWRPPGDKPLSEPMTISLLTYICVTLHQWVKFARLLFMAVYHYSGTNTNRGYLHYNDVTMVTIASLITSLTIVHSTVYLDADQKIHQSSASLAFVQGIHRGGGEFDAQRASNEENVSIWWRHHVNCQLHDEYGDKLYLLWRVNLCTTYRWINARLQILHCYRTGDRAVWH